MSKEHVETVIGTLLRTAIEGGLLTIRQPPPEVVRAIREGLEQQGALEGLLKGFDPSVTR